MVPKWPIAFGDNAKAKELLETALKINPNGIDANYYYADYLFANDEINRAEIYYKKAASASTQADQSYSDIRLKEEAKIALIKTQKQKNSRSNDLLSFFSSSSASKPTLSKQ
jgi:cytochrome c-type biogenesis protein CcmH/NrfG